jgi:phage baseplate assembly protein gpV
MSSALFDSIARIARHEAEARATAGVAVVVDTHLSSGAANDHAVSLKMRDTGLVLSKVPIAVGVLGLAAMPAPGDLVVVVFMEGDYHAPVVVGRLYRPDKNPPAHSEDDLVINFPAGDDSPATNLVMSRSASANIKLKLGDELTVELMPDTATITIGEMKLEITGKSGGRAEIAAGGSTIVMKQDCDVKISSQSKLLIEGNEVEIKGQSKVVIKGAQVDIN